LARGAGAHSFGGRPLHRLLAPPLRPLSAVRSSALGAGRSPWMVVEALSKRLVAPRPAFRRDWGPGVRVYRPDRAPPAQVLSGP
jgi:hypothetical protein